MKKTNLQWILFAALTLTPTAVLAQETAQPAKPEAPKVSVEAIKSEDGEKPTADGAQQKNGRWLDVDLSARRKSTGHVDSGQPGSA
jgi:hypothetical protein